MLRIAGSCGDQVLCEVMGGSVPGGARFGRTWWQDDIGDLLARARSRHVGLLVAVDADLVALGRGQGHQGEQEQETGEGLTAEDGESKCSQAGNSAAASRRNALPLIEQSL